MRQPSQAHAVEAFLARYLLSSHDGFGLGHLRRNLSVADALLQADRRAQVMVATGVADRPRWREASGVRFVTMPALLKDGDGAYRNPGMSFEAALTERAVRFDAAVRDFRPDVVVVDRHPYGIGGELRPGLGRARNGGATLVLGLRDILDEPTAVATEINGSGWDGVQDEFDLALVYGDPRLCDHDREYGLGGRLPLHYVGFVANRVPPQPVDHRLVVIAAGGGGDGDGVYRLGLRAVEVATGWRAIVVAGPFAARPSDHLCAALGKRIELRTNVDSCPELLSRAAAVVQMAGYNSTYEALAAGLRPILVPRRSPRREQAIRACRLASFGLADVVDEAAHPDEVAWLLSRQRHLAEGQLERSGFRLDGAAAAATILRGLVRRHARSVA